MKLRPEVRRFAERMERALRDNDHKGDSWRSMFDEEIMDRIADELKELKSILSDQPKRRAEECADVANFLMFYSEKRRHLKKYR